MDYAADLEMDRPGGLLPPLALSLLAHALLAILFLGNVLRAPEAPSTPFDVQILQPEQTTDAKSRPRAEAAPKAPAAEPPIAPPKKQIVAPSDAPEAKPDKTNLFSDRDSRAIEETIKHGQPAPPAKPPQETAKQKSTALSREDQATKAQGDPQAKAEPQPATKVPPVLGPGDLFVKPSELARDPSLLKGDSGESERTAEGGKRDLAMLDRPDLWAEPGPRGSMDYLPNVRDGDLTMLNAKADRFAPFVRRVGLRVFESFTMQFKNEILSGRVPSGRDNVEVEAIMSRDGKRVEVLLKQRQGDLGTDRILLGNLGSQTFFDDNPPAEAVAADGRIHFVFALNSVVQHDGGGRRGGRGQPGARWVMGAGLL